MDCLWCWIHARSLQCSHRSVTLSHMLHATFFYTSKNLAIQLFALRGDKKKKKIETGPRCVLTVVKGHSLIIKPKAVEVCVYVTYVCTRRQFLWMTDVCRYLRVCDPLRLVTKQLTNTITTLITMNESNNAPAHTDTQATIKSIVINFCIVLVRVSSCVYHGYEMELGHHRTMPVYNRLFKHWLHHIIPEGRYNQRFE